MQPVSVTILDWPPPLGVLEKNGAVPKDTGHIQDDKGRDVDNGFDYKLGVGKGAIKGAYKAGSLPDVVDEILRRTRGKCIDKIDFVGHGAPGEISVGAGKRQRPKAEIDGRPADWEPQLRRLCGRLCKDADKIEIRLIGCSTGVCRRGAKKLHKLATFFHDCMGPDAPQVCVSGTDRTIYPDDVRDLLAGKKGNILVTVCSDDAPPDRCIRAESRDGLREREGGGGTKRRKGGEKARRPRYAPDPEDYRAIAFRSTSPEADSVFETAFLVPPPITPAEFLALFDLTTPYEAKELAARHNGEVVLQRADGATEVLPVLLGFTALQYTSPEAGDSVFALRDMDDAELVRQLFEPE